MERPAETIAIGRLAGVHGLRGEAKVDVFSDVPERFLNIKQCWVQPKRNGPWQHLTVESVRVHKGRALVKFQGFSTPEQLAPLLRLDLHIAKDDRQPLGPDEYYVTDLLGLTVRLPDGRLLGTLKHVIETGANDVYEVVDDEGQTALIPAIGDVIAKVDLDARIIDITPLPGLLD